MTDTVTLAVELTCIVGLLARERVTPQPLVIRVALEVDLEQAGTTGRIGASVDYAALDAQIRFLAGEGRFVLLESLALAIARLALLPPAPGERRAQVEAVEVAIEKPAVLPSSLPGVRLRRTRWSDEHLVDLPEVSVQRRTLASGERGGGKPGGALFGIVGVDGLHREVVGPAVVLEIRQRPGEPMVTLPAR